uniref:CRISPR-associated protein Cas5 n=1 Tax=Thermofilum pendens TaxID=2269 RepID=A0A7C4FCA7_THEPE
MRGYSVDVEFTWGFQARVAGLGKSPPSFLFPPPTTLVGALAASYSRRVKRGESEGVELMLELSRHILALSFRPLNARPLAFMDVGRVIAPGQRGGVYYPTVRDVFVYKSFDAPARGSTIMGSIDNEPPRIRYVLVVEDDGPFTQEDLWSIRRLGSKESLVSVVRVEEIPVFELGGSMREERRTLYATPEVEGLRVKKHEPVARELYVSPYRLNYPPSAAYVQGVGILSYLIPMRLEYAEGYLEVSGAPSGYSFYEVEDLEKGRNVVVGVAR